jgi:hypothetical protein
MSIHIYVYMSIFYISLILLCVGYEIIAESGQLQSTCHSQSEVPACPLDRALMPYRYRPLTPVGGAESGPLQEQLPTVVLGNVLGCTAEGQAFAATEVYTHTHTHLHTYTLTHTHARSHSGGPGVRRHRGLNTSTRLQRDLPMPARRPTKACKETY